MRENALEAVSRFPMLRFSKLNKFAAANYFAFLKNAAIAKTAARARRKKDIAWFFLNAMRKYIIEKITF